MTEIPKRLKKSARPLPWGFTGRVIFFRTALTFFPTTPHKEGRKEEATCRRRRRRGRARIQTPSCMAFGRGESTCFLGSSPHGTWYVRHRASPPPMPRMHHPVRVWHSGERPPFPKGPPSLPRDIDKQQLLCVVKSTARIRGNGTVKTWLVMSRNSYTNLSLNTFAKSFLLKRRECFCVNLCHGL